MSTFLPFNYNPSGNQTLTGDNQTYTPGAGKYAFVEMDAYVKVNGNADYTYQMVSAGTSEMKKSFILGSNDTIEIDAPNVSRLVSGGDARYFETVRVALNINGSAAFRKDAQWLVDPALGIGSGLVIFEVEVTLSIVEYDIP
jgi:hypothetical protein